MEKNNVAINDNMAPMKAKQTNKDIHLAFICDENYALCTGVAIASLKQHKHPEFIYHIHIILDKVSAFNTHLLSMLGDDTCIMDLIDSADLSADYASFTRMNFVKHVSPAALYKFNLPEIFNKIDKLLYMDGDILIHDDLVDLYNTNIEDVIAAVCEDIGAETFPAPFNQRLKTQHKKYFNSGVMLLNLKRMREEQITEKLLEYKRDGINDFMDQDTLNVVFAERVVYFSYLYNMTITGWTKYSCETLNKFYGLKMQDKASFYQQAKVLHLCGPEKPWKYSNVIGGEDWLIAYIHSPFQQLGIQRTLYTGFSYRASIGEELDLTSLPGTQPASFDFREEPYVSVVTPVYNAETHLAECVESLMSQTLQNCEFIFVDDGSTDRSSDILRMYERLDNRVKVFTQENAGAGIARNTGIAHAKGNYVTFLDSDDIMRSDALEIFYRRAETLGVDMVICEAVSFKDDILKTREMSSSLRKEFLPERSLVFSKDTWSDRLMQVTYGMPWGKFIRRQLIEENAICFPALPRSEDLCFVYWAMVQAKSITTIDQKLIYYRSIDGSGSLEDAKDKYPTASIEAYKILYQKFQELGVADMLKQTFVNYMLNSIAYNIRTFKTGTAFIAMANRVCEEIIPTFEIDLTQEDYFYFKNDLPLFRDLLNSGNGANYLYSSFKRYKGEADRHWKELKVLRAEKAHMMQPERKQTVTKGGRPKKIQRAYHYLKKHGFKKTVRYIMSKLKRNK